MVVARDEIGVEVVVLLVVVEYVVVVDETRAHVRLERVRHDEAKEDVERVDDGNDVHVEGECAASEELRLGEDEYA